MCTCLYDKQEIAYGTWAPLAKHPIVDIDIASKLARSIRHGSWRGERTRCTLDVSVYISRVPRTYGTGVGDSRLGEYGTWNIGFWVYARQFSRRAENINFDVSPFMREKGGEGKGSISCDDDGIPIKVDMFLFKSIRGWMRDKITWNTDRYLANIKSVFRPLDLHHRLSTISWLIYTRNCLMRWISGNLWRTNTYVLTNLKKFILHVFIIRDNIMLDKYLFFFYSYL